MDLFVLQARLFSGCRHICLTCREIGCDDYGRFLNKKSLRLLLTLFVLTARILSQGVALGIRGASRRGESHEIHSYFRALSFPLSGEIRYALTSNDNSIH